MFDEKKVSCMSQLHFIDSNVSGDITIVKLSACTPKIAMPDHVVQDGCIKVVLKPPAACADA